MLLHRYKWLRRWARGWQVGRVLVAYGYRRGLWGAGRSYWSYFAWTPLLGVTVFVKHTPKTWGIGEGWRS